MTLKSPISSRPDGTSVSAQGPARTGKTDPRAFRPTDAISRTREAGLLIRDNRLREAESLLADLFKENPHDPHPAVMLLGIYSRTKELDKAEQVFALANDSDSANDRVYNEMIRTCFHCKSFDRAEALYRESMDKGNAQESLFTTMIDGYGKSGKADKARKFYDLAVDYGYYTCGCNGAMLSAYITAKRYKGAARMLADSIDEGVADAQMFNCLIRHFAMRGEYDDVKFCFNLAVRCDEADPLLCKSAMHVFLDAGRLEDAREAYDAASNMKLLDGSMLYIMANAYIKIGNLDEARKIIDKAEQISLLDPKLALSMLDALLLGADMDGACSLVSRYFRRQPFDSSLFKKVENLLYKTHRFQKLLDLIASFPEHIQNAEYLTIRKAECLRKMGMHDQAITLLKSALDSGRLDNSRQRTAKVVIAYSLKEKGDTEAAFDMFRCLMSTALGYDINTVRAGCGLVSCWERKGFQGLERSEISTLHRHLAHYSGNVHDSLDAEIRRAIGLLGNRMR